MVRSLARISGIGYALFLSLFALDVFSEYLGPAIIVPLLMHLIPSLALLGVIAVSWRYDLVGAAVFLGFAVFYIASVGFDRPLSWYTYIALPSAAIGMLFIIGWMQRKAATSP